MIYGSSWADTTANNVDVEGNSSPTNDATVILKAPRMHNIVGFMMDDGWFSATQRY